MNRAHPRRNPPVTAAGLASVVVLVLAAFTDLSTEQTAAVAAAVSIMAAFAAQQFTTPWWRGAVRRPDLEDHADHADPDAFHDQ